MNLQKLAQGLFLHRRDSESMFHRFWKWWSGEILDLVPPVIRKALDHHEPVLLVSVHDHDMTVDLCHGTRRQTLDKIQFDSLSAIESGVSRAEQQQGYPAADTIVVELSAAQTICRHVSLPMGTEDRITDVLGYEMDRLTPFEKDDVYFHHRVTGRDVDRRVINIDLVVALRRTVDDILLRLSECGIVPTKLTLRGAALSADRSLAAVNLLPRESRADISSKRPLLPTVLTALALLLAVIAIAYPPAYQKIYLTGLEEEISRLGPAAAAAERTRGEIAEAVRQGGFIADKWASMPTKIGLLNELTRIVPDDTWLVRVQVLGAIVRIHGESDNASSLIGLLESSDWLSDARFSSPVTKNPRTSNDRFVIEARIKSGNGDK